MKLIKIGKSRDNDIVLSSENVSRHHAQLKVIDNKVSITDLGSTNGTYVNGKRISGEVWLNAADTVRLADSPLDWKSAAAATPATKVSQAGAIPPVSMGADVQQLLTIGRDASMNIRMAYDDVSSKHATLQVMKNGTVVLVDNNSTNGTFVNGERIVSRTLKKGDAVTLCRKYAVDWERYVPKHAAKGGSSNKNAGKWGVMIGVAAAVVALCVVFWWNKQTISEEEMYDKYNSAVALLYFQYGYEVKINGENAHELFKIDPNQTIVYNSESKQLATGVKSGTGTGFFISNDGKIATNLHVARPWLYSEEKDIIKQKFLGFLKMKALTENPFYDTLLPALEVEGKILSMVVIPNGLPLDNDNCTSCMELVGHNEIDKDVAIVQTVTHALPSGVSCYIDMAKADMSDNSIKQGKKVYLIGYPYGVGVAHTETGLQNQLQTGLITQDRGTYEFGHNAATAGGASGSPILNEKGHLIGIHHAGLTGVTGAQGFNRAIKVKYLNELLNK
jgi:pSer/pThr/pTyr-binding forkhead associated (FHA) protein